MSSPFRGATNAAPSESVQGFAQKIERMLANKQVREALDLAKARLKAEPGTAAEILTVRCYAARAREMDLAGQGNDAKQIVAYAAQRFPKHAHLLNANAAPPAAPNSASTPPGAALAVPVAHTAPAVRPVPGNPQPAAVPAAAAQAAPKAAMPKVALSEADIDRRVEQLIAEKQIRTALEEAKAWLKAHPGECAELRVVRCYQARSGELFQRGQENDAQQLLAHAVAKFPQHAHLIGLRFVENPAEAEFTAAVPDDRVRLLTEAGTPGVAAARRLEIAAEISARLKDPRDLIENPALPADDPWRAEARCAWQAFEAVTTRPVSEDELSGLESISRRSPLAGWKLLIRALHAFYSGRNENLARNLSALPSGSSVAALAPMLLTLAGLPLENGLPLAGAANEAMLRELSAGIHGLQAALKDAEIQFARGRADRGYGAVAGRMKLLRRYRPELARELQVGLARCAVHNEEIDEDDVLREQASQLYGSGTPDERAALAQAAALAFERELPYYAVEMWERFLSLKEAMPRPEQLSPSERRLIHCRIVALMPKAEAKRSPLLAMLEHIENEELGPLPDFAKIRNTHLHAALAAEPTPDLFSQLYETQSAKHSNKAEQTLAEWHRAFPGELAPILILMRAAEKRSALQKTLGLLAEAERINALHPEVRAARVRVEYVQACKHIQAGQTKLAERDIDRIVALDDPLMGVVVESLRFALAVKSQNEVAMQRALASLRAVPGHPFLPPVVGLNVTKDCGLWSVHDQVGAKHMLDRLGPNPLADAASMEAFLDATDLMHRLGSELSFAIEHRESAEKLLRDGADWPEPLLARICHSVFGTTLYSLMYLAAGKGLALNKQFAHHFFYYRALALSRSVGHYQYRQRIEQCLRAAMTLARQRRDLDLAQKADSALKDSDPLSRTPFGPDPERSQDLTDVEIQKALKVELLAERKGIFNRKNKAPTWKEPKVKPPKRRKKKSLPDPPDLIFDEE